MNKSYTTSAYFWAKIVSDLPFLILYPLILANTVYFVIHLNEQSEEKFLIFCNSNSLSLSTHTTLC